MEHTYTHPALSHLQITFTPDEYRAIRQKYARGPLFLPRAAGPDYWDRLPLYTVARCPFTAHPFTAALDTHELTVNWQTYANKWQHIFHERYQQMNSPYFVAVHSFINLHGTLPVESSFARNSFDVPFVLPYFLPDDMPASAVMHSLPICSLIGDQFIPRYTVYTITYYAEEPHVLLDRRRAAEKKWGEGDPEYRYVMLATPGAYRKRQPEVWDLPLWVQRQRLRWLDPSTEGLPLRAGPVEAFPYANIAGERRSYTVHKGKIDYQNYSW
ncbi:MAG: hypothetical protein HC876_18490 [Chloroflexaceae bacterium]|nr:hypothetical protein [Chloroflexaceae bacterium]